MSDEIVRRCRACNREVPPDHQGPCPHCGENKGLDIRATPLVAEAKFTASMPTVKHVAKWWVWNPLYLGIFILATLGSLVFGFFPGWGGVVSAVCTIIATVTGFKAGVKYHKETIR